MDGVEHHRRLVTAHARHHVGGEKLWDLPTDRMDGRHEADQSGRMRELADKEWQDCAEGPKPDCPPKGSTVYQVGGQIVAQVTALGGLDGGHGRDCTAKAASPLEFAGLWG